MNPDPTANASLADQALQASRAGDCERAIELFTAAIAAAPGNPGLHHLLAAEYAQLGRTLEAEASFACAVLLDATLHVARFQLGLLQYS